MYPGSYKAVLAILILGFRMTRMGIFRLIPVLIGMSLKSLSICLPVAHKMSSGHLVLSQLSGVRLVFKEHYLLCFAFSQILLTVTAFWRPVLEVWVSEFLVPVALAMTLVALLESWLHPKSIGVT